MSLRQHPDHGNLKVLENALMTSALTKLRNKYTTDENFALIASRMAPFVVFEALHDFPLGEKYIETPVASMKAATLDGTKISLVSILGAGQALLHNVRQTLLPWASESYIAASRDEKSFQPTLHYERLPEDLSDSLTVVLDPMLATGGSSSAVIQLLKDCCGARNIILVCIVAAPEGVSLIKKEHPKVRIVTVALDQGLTDDKFITPGLGDFGDRFTGVTPRKK